ncbi:hypothetical protein KDW78_04995 [Burkholderia cenocepacia]|uniref:hypothetical protein n=1 Tax=Burkholderia cenocepacia TaxID=95486 RepID=UPI00158B7959|nr:hypothetical protein [Burkholderia cenocepacia]MBR7953232.1 hypothetical protein [Burkholderia cenocepacia]
MKGSTRSAHVVLTLDALVDACVRFDPSDGDQRLIVRTLVVPMLARRLKWLGLLLRASPRSEATRTMLERIEGALACAAARLEAARRPSADRVTNAVPRRGPRA